MEGSILEFTEPLINLVKKIIEKMIKFKKLKGVSVSSLHCGLKKNKKDDSKKDN